MHGSPSARRRGEVASYAPESPLARASHGVTPEWLLTHKLCLVSDETTDDLRVLVSAATDDADICDLECQLGTPLTRRVTTQDVIERAVEAFRQISAGNDGAPLLVAAPDESDPDTRGLASQPPVIRYVSLLVREAVAADASDIHLEVGRSGLTARFRVDGVLSDAPPPPTGMHAAVVSRCKLLAGLDIAERRRPQDGRIRMRMAESELDLRVSTVPTLHGESVVIRLLDRGDRPVALSSLGIPGEILASLVPLLARPQGLLLVTGPTGSGKTTTLYAALAHRNNGAEKLITVEDPVEYQIPGVTQVPVHHATGVSFASALRAILRQDPDVLLIGELRDSETAAVAIQAAMTGHLVLATLHTNDALSAFARLVDLGVPPYLLVDTVSAVVAQRLVRRVCDSCASVRAASGEELHFLEQHGMRQRDLVFREGSGCQDCRGTGFRGRIGVFEAIVPDAALRRAIASGAGHDDLLRCLRDTGHISNMITDGLAKAAAGTTTISEVRRVANL